MTPENSPKTCVTGALWAFPGVWLGLKATDFGAGNGHHGGILRYQTLWWEWSQTTNPLFRPTTDFYEPNYSLHLGITIETHRNPQEQHSTTTNVERTKPQSRRTFYYAKRVVAAKPAVLIWALSLSFLRISPVDRIEKWC